MVSTNSVSAVKGKLAGYALIKRGGHTGTVSADTDWEEEGFLPFALINNENGVGFSRSADSTKITGWGEQDIDEIWSNNAVTTTLNIFSFLDFETLKTLFGADNVTRVGTVTTVSGKGISSAEKNSIVLIGQDKKGNEVIFYAALAAVDPNFEWTWNDTDPVEIAAVFNLYKDPNTAEYFKMFIEGIEETVIPGNTARALSTSTED